MEAELESTRSAAEEWKREKARLERENTKMEQDGDVVASKLLKETRSLKDFRSYEVTLERVQIQNAMIAKGNCQFANIHDYHSRQDAYETSRNLFG